MTQSPKVEILLAVCNGRPIAVVSPKFFNVTIASMKLMESLPT